MKKSIFILTVLISTFLQAQSPEVRARAAFLKAQELYGNGDYSGAIDRLNSVKEALGSTNPRVEYLLCQSHFANKDAEKAEASMKSYFEMADESDPNYNAMLMMIEEIEAKKEEFRKVREVEAKRRELLAREPEVWSATKNTNSREGYQAYLTLFPNGQFASEARKSLLNFPPVPLTDSRDNATYETVRFGGIVWMMSNLNYSSPDSRCYDDDPENCSEYGRIYGFYEAKEVCPEGWRLPRFNELQSIFRTLELKESAKKNPHVMQATFSDQNFGEFGEKLNMSPGGIFVKRNPPGIKEDTYKLMGEYTLMWTQDGRLVLNAVGKKAWLQLANTDKIPGFRDTDKSLFGYCRCVKGEGEVARTDLKNQSEMEKQLIEKAMNEAMKNTFKNKN